jgi:hypothetical protein
VEQATFGVKLWWTALCVVSLVNVGAWAVSYATFARRRADAPGVYAARWPHLLLSAGYVLGCGFRSFLPRADVQRIVLVDSWLSSVFVGRSVATVAELCFAAQWALILRELSEAEGDKLGLRVSRWVVPMIGVAEVCSWYAVLTTSYLGNALEQSIWTLTVALMAVCLYALWSRTDYQAMRRFLSGSLVACVAFVSFMSTVDVPMYLTRWFADEARGRSYYSLAEGLRDVSQRWTVTHSWSDWHEEIAWMSLYFSVAVWISIALVHAPYPRKARRHSLSPRALPERAVALPAASSALSRR